MISETNKVKILVDILRKHIDNIQDDIVINVSDIDCDSDIVISAFELLNVGNFNKEKNRLEIVKEKPKCQYNLCNNYANMGFTVNDSNCDIDFYGCKEHFLDMISGKIQEDGFSFVGTFLVSSKKLGVD